MKWPYQQMGSFYFAGRVFILNPGSEQPVRIDIP